jgi:hypothetical protein
MVIRSDLRRMELVKLLTLGTIVYSTEFQTGIGTMTSRNNVGNYQKRKARFGTSPASIKIKRNELDFFRFIIFSTGIAHDGKSFIFIIRTIPNQYVLFSLASTSF